MKILAAVRAWCADHKKIVATVIGAAVQLLPDRYLDRDAKTKITEMLMVFVVGQGVADHGKEAAKVLVAPRCDPAPQPIPNIMAGPTTFP
jgi:hypothetical protein